MQTHIHQTPEISESQKTKRERDLEQLLKDSESPVALASLTRELDEDDTPELTFEMLKHRIHGKLGQKKIPITVRLDPDILDWLKAESEKHTAKGYQTYMNSLLREVMNMSLYGHLMKKKIP